MIIKFIRKILASSAIAILPALGNRGMYDWPQIWILFVVYFFALFLQPNYHVIKDRSKDKDKGTEIQIVWSAYITQVFAVLEAAYLRFPDSVKWNALTTISLIIMIAGLALRTWSIYTLGNCFTMYLDIKEEHKIICRGPYKYLRHPSYVGAFFIYVGAPVFLHSWYSLVAAAIILSIAWLRRIRYEEEMLIEAFGEEYKSYCKKVKRAIPWLW